MTKFLRKTPWMALLLLNTAHAQSADLTAVMTGDLSGYEKDTPEAQKKTQAMADLFAHYIKLPESEDSLELKENCPQSPEFSAACPLLETDQKVAPKVLATPLATRKGFYDAVSRLNNPATRPLVCAASETELAAIFADPAAVPLHSRSLFWRWVCARTKNEDALAKNILEELWDRYPFDYHTAQALEIAGDHRMNAAINSNRPLEVNFRSVTHPELNLILATLEALYRKHENFAAANLAERFVSRFSTLEPEVRLYLASLLSRNGRAMPSILVLWRVLYPLLEENPAWRQRETLQMLFPLDYVLAITGPSTTFTVADLLHEFKDQMDSNLLASLIHQESAFNPRAKSAKGAYGLMQILLGAARDVRAGMTAKELLDPRTNLTVAIADFRNRLHEFSGQLAPTLASYNAGVHGVKTWVVNHPALTDPAVQMDLMFMDNAFESHVALYVASILGKHAWYTKLYGHP